MTLDVSFERVNLATERPFRISRESTDARSIAVVRIRDGNGRVGLGAAAPSAYYGETIDSVCDRLPGLIDVVTTHDDSFACGTIHERMVERTDGADPAARAGIDIALHDLVAKRIGVPLYRYLGFGGDHRLNTSYTIGIDEPEAMAEHAEEAIASGYDVLKVKLGTPHDDTCIRRIRAVAPDARIRVDANCAWDRDEALERIEVLAANGVEFVEQPVAADDHEALAHVHEQSPLPIAADESCRDVSDVPCVADRCDIVTVKLMKTGGIRGAIEQIHAARAHGCQVMLGCMLESDVSIAAAAHLIPYATFADLDGSILLADDPFEGAPIDGNTVGLHPALAAGTGAT